MPSQMVLMCVAIITGAPGITLNGHLALPINLVFMSVILKQKQEPRDPVPMCFLHLPIIRRLLFPDFFNKQFNSRPTQNYSLVHAVFLFSHNTNPNES